MVKYILRIFFALAGGCFTFTVSAQNELDALRYSTIEPIGNARFAGMAGAFSAVGGDLASASWNPAGIGLYRRNDLTLSFAVSGLTTRSDYNGSENRASKYAFHIPNAGMAITNKSDHPDWVFVNYAVTFNKLQNFNQRTVIRGNEFNNTLLNVYMNQANGTPFDQLAANQPFGAGLAWNTFLLDTIPGTIDQYITAIPFGKVTQEMTIETSGHMSETAVSLGGNYRDRLYLGGTIGFPSVRYNQTTTYREFGTEDQVDLQDYTFTDELVITGSGLNIKLGAIFRASKWLRVSAAWHSRTGFALNDVWDSRMLSNFTVLGSYDDAVQGAFDYRVSTPSRTILGAAFILGRDGLISADYERINYGQAELRRSNVSGSTYDFEVENDVISTIYRATHNVRVGTEWRIMKVFRARGGFAFQQNPFVPGATSINTHLLTGSIGFGYRGKSVYAEFAYQHRNNAREFYIYDPALVNAAELRQNKGEAIITVGLRY